MTISEIMKRDRCSYTQAKARADSEPPFAVARCSGEADPLVAEMRSLAATEYPLCPEARLLLQMAVECQQGKPIDVTRLLPNKESSEPGAK
jgi:hypothetical protein